MAELTRRAFLPLLIAAPAIVRASSLMKVKAYDEHAAARDYIQGQIQQALQQLLDQNGTVINTSTTRLYLSEAAYRAFGYDVNPNPHVIMTRRV